MKKYIEGFIDQLEDGFAIGMASSIRNKNDISNVLITGVGGSGIGGTIVSKLATKSSRVPIYVNKSYTIPKWVDERTLVIASSYSGNTEETLSALDQAISLGAKICCVTSGGKLEQIARDKEYELIKIPSGFPPRAAFALSSVQLVIILCKSGLMDESYLKNLDLLPEFLRLNQLEIQNTAHTVADHLYQSIPVIYTSDSYEGIAIRFRQQLNENSKMLAWHHVIPEMNHNELVGWTNKELPLSVLVFDAEDDYVRTKKRMDICVNIISEYAKVMRISALGNNLLERTFFLVLLGDWVSLYLAEKKGIDPVEVNIIDHLKEELSSFHDF